MNYEESYMKCNNLDELLEKGNRDVMIANGDKRLDRIDDIIEAMEKVAKIKGWR